MGKFADKNPRKESYQRNKTTLVTTIKFIYSRLGKCVTGGQRYEQHLREVLGDDAEIEVLRMMPATGVGKWDKLKAIFRESKLKKSLEPTEIIVFNSAQGFYHLPLARKLRKAGYDTVLLHHHFLHMEFSGIKRNLYRKMERAILRSVGRVITPSPYVKDLIKSESGVEAELLPIPFRKESMEPHKNSAIPNNLLFIGTIEPRKGLMYLIEGLSMLQDSGKYKLNIVGKVVDAGYYEALKAKISATRLNVIFHGYQTDSELEQLMEEADVFVFPSMLEGYGMAVNEVRNYGIPVVAFANSALPYSVEDDKDGYLVKNKDSKGFGEAIERICSNRELRASMSDNSLERAKRMYSEEDFVRDAKRLFLNKR